MNNAAIREHLSRYKAGIAGAGGLGSNCAMALARAGVGTLVISDHDLVEASNLNRQYYFLNQVGTLKVSAIKENIARVSENTEIITHAIKLDRNNIPEIFAGCDVIVEALDTDEMKQMLIETVQTALPGIPVVIGSGLSGWGKSNEIRYRKIDDTLYVCGDEYSTSDEDLTPMAPRVLMVAGMQANTVIEILMNKP
ncbi:MAG: sulfur carrier protein ThiS adenylyltransferase ThiF [Bacteroidales bacterium]|nr:sulfur carrier protein ThiS adenylyltransferase ThiF [Bacteroidales bacterium]MBN2634256.1 sulfur carrier protein ThiS adenylyltransferase ThiF [Bacteroidales bacterium]